MILYNASTSSGLRNFARRFANTNATAYSNADLDASINEWYRIFVSEVLDSMDDWDYDGEIATASLVANQQEYTFPSDILKIKRIEYTPDGSNWYPVSFLDVTDIQHATDATTIRNRFTSTEPYADIFDNSIFLYPIPTTSVTGGLKIWYDKHPAELSAATDEPTFNKLYHKGLSYGAAKDFLEQHIEVKGNEVRLASANSNIRDYITRMKQFYSKHNADRAYYAQGREIDTDYSPFN